MSTKQQGLIKEIREIIFQARSLTRRSVNSLQVISNYLIGMRIVIEEQGGHGRAEYGKSILKELSSDLSKEFGRGYSLRNLEYMRQFYLTYAPRLDGKSQTLSGISDTQKVAQALSAELSVAQISQTLSAQLPLSWSHYLFLMGISNVDERRFYEIESANEGWSLRELKRQFNSSLYERLALSKDKEALKRQLEEALAEWEQSHE